MVIDLSNNTALTDIFVKLQRIIRTRVLYYELPCLVNYEFTEKIVLRHFVRI